MDNKIVYLDNNATTQMAPEVLEFMERSSDLYGNASSMHDFGRKAAAGIAWARNEIAALIDASPDEIIFNSGASEANNTVFNIARDLIDTGSPRNRIVTTTIEHPSIVETVKFFRKRGYLVDEAPVDVTGKVDLEKLGALLGPDVLLVSVMTGNNETGTIQPVAEITKLAHGCGALMHTDATQAIGKIPVTAHAWGVDYLSLSGHKFYGPKGVGILFVRKGAPYEPFINGGHQEGGRRAGTYNTNAILGMGKAAELARLNLAEEHDRLWFMREKLRKGLLERVDDIVINGHPVECLPGTLNVSFPRAEGESILLYLDMCGIAVSTGSACATGSLEPSYVLLASGLDVELAHGSIRFSFGRFNTEADVDYVLEKLPPIIRRLREMSTR
ncbi:MAG: aminotransferase class V-fold PLP-dependent enzyme [Sphaerochaetaceae bacterium]|nr:aminotransferase class V-fold PLP-dependent enzyme [Sphaerochaetaceae bacterium]